jgi:hypothetical protein
MRTQKALVHRGDSLLVHTGRDPIRDRERPCGQRVKEAQANCIGGEGNPFSLEKFLPYFHFLFPNKSLLNSFTIFLPPNCLSSREKNPYS